MLVPQPGFWVLSRPDRLEDIAIEVFTYSLDATLQPLRSEAEVGDVERAIFAHLPVRDYGRSPALFGMGTYWVPDEPGTVLVQVTRGAFTNPSDGHDLEVWAFKLRVERGAGRPEVRCVWGRGVGGPLVARVTEDFDGDGIRDYFFQDAADRDMPDLMVSGANGTTIAEVFTSALAVEKNPAEAMRFSVYSMWRRQEGTNQVYRVSPESHEAVRVAAPTGATSQGRPNGAGPRRAPASVGASLVEALGGPERVRIYVLPGGSAPLIEGAEYIQSHGSEVWNWYVNRNPQRIFDASTEGLPLRVLFRYASPGYIERRERERRGKPEDVRTPDVPR